MSVMCQQPDIGIVGLGQFVVENRVGASRNLATEQVVRSRLRNLLVYDERFTQSAILPGANRCAPAPRRSTLAEHQAHSARN
jgi:hypothetical protein